MNFMKLFFAVAMTFVPAALIAEPGTSCDIPWSRSLFIATLQPTEPALPPILTQVTQILSTVSTVMSVATAAGTTQISQGTRAYMALKVAACNDAVKPEEGSLSFSDSPTQLSIGGGRLQYNIGAVVGNWVVMGACLITHGAVAKKMGSEVARFPGALTMPVLFLMAPTASSAWTLLKLGTLPQQFVGGFSMAAQIAGTGLVVIFLHPRFFDARWVLEGKEGEWVDGQNEGYVHRHGMLFGDYRGTRQLFLAGELSMSMAQGVLQSYQASESDCANLVLSAAVVSALYAGAIALLRPNIGKKEQIFYAGIAGVEAAALITQAISLRVASEEVQQKTRTVTESMIMGAEWLLTMKSVYDLGIRIRAAYHQYRPMLGRLLGSTPQVRQNHQDFGSSLLATSYDQELLPLVAPPESVPEPTRELTSTPPSTRAQTPAPDLLEDLFSGPKSSEGVQIHRWVNPDNLNPLEPDLPGLPQDKFDLL